MSPKEFIFNKLKAQGRGEFESALLMGTYQYVDVVKWMQEYHESEVEKARKQTEINAWDAAIVSFAAECGDDMSDEKAEGITIYKNVNEYINRSN